MQGWRVTVRGKITKQSADQCTVPKAVRQLKCGNHLNRKKICWQQKNENTEVLLTDKRPDFAINHVCKLSATECKVDRQSGHWLVATHLVGTSWTKSDITELGHKGSNISRLENFAFLCSLFKFILQPHGNAGIVCICCAIICVIKSKLFLTQTLPGFT